MDRWESFFCRADVTTNAAVGVGCTTENEPRREQKLRRWKTGKEPEEGDPGRKGSEGKCQGHGDMENGVWAGKGSKHNVIPFRVVLV